MTPEELLAECPDLTADDSRAWLAFAAHRERKLATLPAHVERTITDCALWRGELFIHPFDRFFSVGTDKEDFLHSVWANVNALYAGPGCILYFETRRGSSASTGDSTGHNP